MKPLPAKITPDAIREALFEIRFEHSDLPEVVLGQLAGHRRWSAYTKTRMAGGEIPEQLRAMEASLRYVPSLELRPTANEVIRVGFNVVSHHNVGTYLGWDGFLPKLLETVQVLFEAVPSAKVSRLGLRYINALIEREHLVRSIYDLDLAITVENLRPSPQVQLIYELKPDGDLAGTVRVITPNYVASPPPPGSVALIDIDIYTAPTLPISDQGSIESWLDRAHIAEKSAFFSLLKEETIRRLQER